MSVPSPIQAAFEDVLSITEIFDRNGFVVVNDMIGEADLTMLREAYDDALNGRTDFAGNDRELGGVTRQIMVPHLFDSRFLKNEAVAKGAQIAASIFGETAPELMFSMLIYKPPGHPHVTPWHQDMAYAGRPVTPTGARLPNDAILQFWLALDDVDEETGCMTFVPGKHNDPMPEHFVASGDPEDESRLLAMTAPEQDLDLAKAVPCPLSAGSATMHGYATPHYTGANRSSERGRRAFIFSFAHPNALAAISGGRGDWKSSSPTT